MAKNGRDTKNTRPIARKMHYVRNGEKCKMHKIDWCEVGLQLADIGTKNVSEPDRTPRMKYTMCMAKNGNDTKHNIHIARRMHSVRNGEKCKMHKIDWCEGGLQLADIGTKNVSEPDLTPRMKYTMVRL